MTLTLLTSCTNRKRLGLGRRLRPPQFGELTIDQYASLWWARAQACDVRVHPAELYCGRSFQVILQVASRIGAPLHVVSAGFGLVGPLELIPPYDFTTADIPRGGPQKGGYDVRHQWWSAINQARGKPRPLKALLQEAPTGLLLIALSSEYLRLIAKELSTLSDTEWMRIRIITGTTSISPLLVPITMPYDTRFDGPDSPLPGTRTDFAARAAHHFTLNVLREAPEAPPEQHAELVRQTLRTMRPPPDTDRPRASDAEIKALIEKHWDDAQGLSGRMLRLLRDQVGVACEQNRFARLFRNVKESRG